MYSYLTSPKNFPSLPGVSLRKLLGDRYQSLLTDYVSMSVTHLGEHTVISLTTTESDPVTYSTVVSASEVVDPHSLVFVAQHDRGEI